MRRRGEVVLPSPKIAFGADFLARVGRFAVRLASARERREGAGRNRLQGVGAEIVGFRPYRPGEDSRALDWSLYARHRRPFVRVTAREASESWAVLLDTSASMGVGVPGKLQRAAEVAVTIAAVGLRGGAEVRLFVAPDAEGPRLRRTADLCRWIAFLERQSASGASGLGAWEGQTGRVREAGRVFLLGDFLDLEPVSLDGFVRRGRELLCVQLLAPAELAPGEVLTPGSAVEWVDAEGGRRRVVILDRGNLDLYERRLDRRLLAWGRACAHRRAFFGCRSSAEPFEVVAGDVFGG